MGGIAQSVRFATDTRTSPGESRENPEVIREIPGFYCSATVASLVVDGRGDDSCEEKGLAQGSVMRIGDLCEA